MKCEACGGDGLIEVGAYRGDEDGADTRPCRLCGGVVTLETYREQVSGERKVTTTFKDEHGQMRTLHEVGSAGHAAQQLKQLAHASSESGVRIRDHAARQVADDYERRLKEQNEREQIAAEMNKVIRGLK